MVLILDGVNDAATNELFRDGLRSPLSRNWGFLSPPLSPKAAGKRSGAQAPRLRQPRGAPDDAEAARCAFRWLLLTKHRSTLSAWRTIDPLGHGRLSFYDFCRAATTLGCLCDTRKLWEALDIHQDGFVSLDEVDPDLAELLRGFAMAVSQTVGSAASAWRAYFSSAGRLGRCPFPRFARISRSLGYAGDVDAVYDALNVDRTPSGVSFKEFAMLDKWFRRPTHGRWDYEGLRPLNAEGLRPVSSVSTPDLHLPSV